MAAAPRASVPIKQLKQSGSQALGKKSGALRIQMRAIQKNVLGQFGMLEGQDNEQAFFGSGGLNLIGGVVHVAGRRNQEEEARAALPAKPIQQSEAWEDLRYNVTGGRERPIFRPKIRGQVIDIGRGLSQEPIVNFAAVAHPTAEGREKIVD